MVCLFPGICPIIPVFFLSFSSACLASKLVFSGIFPPGRNDSCCGGAKEGGGGEEGKSEGRAGVYIQHDESDEDCCLHEEHPAWRRRALLHTVNCLLQSRRILQWEEEERDGKLSSSSSSAVISSSPSNSPRESYTTTALACLLGGEENEEGGDEDLRLLLDNLVKLRFESAAESSEHSDLQVSSSSSEKGEADKTLLDNDVAPRDLQIMERLLFGENEARPSFPQESSHSNLSARRCEVQEEGGSSSSWGEDFFSGEIEKNEESLRCIRSWKGGGEGSSLDSERTRDEEEEEEEERAVQRVRRRTCHLASRILVSFIDDSFDTNVSSDPEEDWRLHLSPKSLQETPLENTGDASSFYDVGQDEDGKGARTAWREEGAGRGIGLGRLYTAVPVDLSRYVSWQSLLGVLGDAFVEDDDACARRDADGDVARMMKLQEEEKQKEKDSVTIKALQSANASLLQEIADLKNQLSQRKSVEEQEKEGRGRGGDSGRVVMSGTQAGGTKNASERADEDQSKTSRISAASASLAGKRSRKTRLRVRPCRHRKTQCAQLMPGVRTPEGDLMLSEGSDGSLTTLRPRRQSSLTSVRFFVRSLEFYSSNTKRKEKDWGFTLSLSLSYIHLSVGVSLFLSFLGVNSSVHSRRFCFGSTAPSHAEGAWTS